MIDAAKQKQLTACNIASRAYFLNTLLDYEHVLYKKIRGFQNNAGGWGLYSRNECVDVQYILVERIIDEIETEIFHLGYFPEISLKGFLILGLSQELKKQQDCSVKDLLKDIDFIILSLQQNAKMFSSRYGADKNFLARLVRTHRKLALMLSTRFCKAGEFLTMIDSTKPEEFSILDSAN